MALPHNPNQYHLLAALPAAEFERLVPHLDLIPMLLGETLYEPGGQLPEPFCYRHTNGFWLPRLSA